MQRCRGLRESESASHTAVHGSPGLKVNISASVHAWLRGFRKASCSRRRAVASSSSAMATMVTQPSRLAEAKKRRSISAWQSVGAIMQTSESRSTAYCKSRSPSPQATPQPLSAWNSRLRHKQKKINHRACPSFRWHGSFRCSEASLQRHKYVVLLEGSHREPLCGIYL